MFAFNYVEGTWGIFQDSYSALGRIHPNKDRTWATFTNVTDTWEDLDYSWSSYKINEGVTRILGGNQQGYTMILNQRNSDEKSLYVNSFTDAAGADPGYVTSANHNLETDDFVYFVGVDSGVQWSLLSESGDVNETSFKIEVVNTNSFRLLRRLPNNGPFAYVSISGSSSYIGTGEIILLKNFSIKSKKFNPFIESNNSGVRLLRTDFYVNTTSEGKFTYNLFIDDNDSKPVNTPFNPRNLSSNVVPTTIPSGFKVEDQSKIWVRNTNQAAGTFIQFELTLSDDQKEQEDEKKLCHSVTTLLFEEIVPLG